MTGPDRERDTLQDPIPSASGRDSEVIRAISEQELSVFTFDGLRRLLGAHPETLSRSLDRLEEEGILARSPEGYTTTPKAKTANRIKAASSGNRILILQTVLPYGASQRLVVSALQGRWFDRMRWVGMSDAEGGNVLKWVSEDCSILIDAKFSAGQLDIGATISRDSDIPSAVRAAHQLMGRIARMYSSVRPGTRRSLLRTTHFVSPAM